MKINITVATSHRVVAGSGVVCQFVSVVDASFVLYTFQIFVVWR